MSLLQLLRALAAVSMLGTALAHAQPQISIRIGAAGASDHAPAFVGVERGIFAKHGLDAKIVMYQTGPEMINGLLAGAQDVNIMGSLPFLAGVSNGQPLLLIAYNHGDPHLSSYAPFSVVATASTGIREGDVKSLIGKKIGMPRGTAAEGYAVGILAQAGVKASEVTLVNVPPASSVAALRQGDVDAIAGWEPWGSTTAMRVPGAFRVASGGCVGCFDPGTILTTRANAVSKNEALRRFMLAYAESQQWVRQNFDAAAEINLRWIPGVDLDIMKVAIRRSTYDLRMSKRTVEGFNTKTIPSLLQGKRIAKAFDVRSAIDPQFFQYAEQAGPQFFSDLKPIPLDVRY
jgi:sulfonate transport system substrate-binding protein